MIPRLISSTQQQNQKKIRRIKKSKIIRFRTSKKKNRESLHLNLKKNSEIHEMLRNSRKKKPKPRNKIEINKYKLPSPLIKSNFPFAKPRT